MVFQKQIFILIGIIFSIAFSNAQMQSDQNLNAPSDSINSNYLAPRQIAITDSIVNYGKMFLNAPYHYGSPGSNSFDCSGFTSFVYRNFGYNLHRSSREQAEQFDTVKRDQLKTGDLVYFAGRRRSNRVGHVGIVIDAKETGEFNFIHAAVHSGVTISSSQEDYYTKRYIKANRVIGGNALFAANGSFSKNENNLSSFPTPFTNSVTQTQKVIPAQYHTVKLGESLPSIAYKYKTSINDLIKINNLTDDRVDTKQVLKIKDEEVVIVSEAKNTFSKKTSKVIDKKPDLEEKKIEPNPSNQSASNHVVKDGESLYSIAKMYNLTIDELKKFNNINKKSIYPGQELKLAQEIAETASTTSKIVETAKSDESIHKTETTKKIIKHKVKSGESLYSIAEDYNISIEDLKKLNNIETSNIQPGQKLKIAQPSETIGKETEKKSQTSSKNITHKVQSGESLYTISKQYDVSIDDLKKYNNIETSNIQPGQKLIISSGTEKAKVESVKKITHKVQSGDSYYSLAKTYGCSVEDLKEWNNKSENKIKIGDKIIIHTKNN
jgi:LysM repeat protein